MYRRALRLLHGGKYLINGTLTITTNKLRSTQEESLARLRYSGHFS